MFRRFFRIIFVLLCFFIGYTVLSNTFLSPLVSAQEPTTSITAQSSEANEEITSDVTPSFSFFSKASNLSSDKKVLVSKAQIKGTVRVIVGIDATFQPEGKLLRAADIQNQRQKIAQAQNDVLQKMASYRVRSVRKFRYVPYMALEVDKAALNKLITDAAIVSIQEDVPVPPALSNSIPLIGADDVWTSGYSGENQTIAILDTGVDKSHPFLSGKVVSEACYSTTDSYNNSTTLCPNGAELQIGSGAGVNCSTTVNGCEHGTHVAGIAAGKGYNIAGVAKDADLIAIQVFSQFENKNGVDYCRDVYNNPSPEPCILTYTSDQISALERVYALRDNYNIAAVNMSLGGGYYTTTCDSDPRKAIIDTLRSAGIATIIASGNEGYTYGISSPACISSAISVGSTNYMDQVASFSNSASFVDLLAPGVGIWSSIPGTNFESFNGTSMAAPHVAGAWAVLRSKYPEATVDDILSALNTTGVVVLDTRNGINKSRIQIDDAADLLLSSDTTPPNATWISPANNSTIRAQSVTLKANASDDSSGVDYVRFRAKYSGSWHDLHYDYAAPYEFDWDLCVAEVSNEQIEFGLQAYDKAGNEFVYSEYYPNRKIYKDYNCVSPPTNVQASDGTYTDKVHITWNASTGATSYEVWRHTSDNPVSATRLAASISSTSYDDTLAVAGQTYFYWVKAKNAAGPSGFSSSDTGYSQPPGDQYESDDSSTQATLIESGDSQTHSIIPIDDEDWVKFTLNEESEVTIETSGSSNVDDTQLRLYDSNINEIEFDDDGGFAYFSKITRECGDDALSAGDYYVRVNEYYDNDEIAEYDISLTVSPCLTEVTVDSVLTVDSFDSSAPHRSSFEPGEQVRMKLAVNNQTTLDIPSLWTVWVVRPDGNTDTVETNSAYDIKSGAWWVYTDPYTVPDDTGIYTYFATFTWNNGQNQLQEAITFDVIDEILAPPTNVQASDGDFIDKIRITWDPVIGATSYEVWRDDFFPILVASSVDGTSYDDSTVVPGQTYYYWVEATNSAGTSEFSDGDSGYARAYNLNQPGLPYEVNTTSSTITFSWVDNSDNEIGFNIYKWNSLAEEFVYYNEVESNVTVYTDSGLNCNSKHWYKVTAFNDDDESERTEWLEAKTAVCPLSDTVPPSFLVDNPLTNSPLISPVLGQTINTPRPTFDWHDAVDDVGVAGYTLQLTDSSGGLALEVSSSSINISESNYTPTSDLADGTYTWSVQAYDAAGNTTSFVKAETFTVVTSSDDMEKVYIPIVIK